MSGAGATRGSAAAAHLDVVTDGPDERSFGERSSDVLAASMGSWKFILSSAVFIAAYTTFQRVSGRPFDPYPFILLNLILSCLAAFQAPIIMMAQNRQEARDRARAIDTKRTVHENHAALAEAERERSELHRQMLADVHAMTEQISTSLQAVTEQLCIANRGIALLVESL